MSPLDEALSRFRDALAAGEPPPASASRPVEHAADDGDAEAQYQLGRWRERQHGDPYRGVRWYERAAVQGHGPAASALAAFHRAQIGDAEPESPSAREAARPVAAVVRHWYERAAAAGGSVPLAELQAPLWLGAVEPASDGRWSALQGALEALASSGNADAAHRLGVAAWRGDEDVSPEPWLRAAAEAGHREAMHALGEWHLEQFDEEHFDSSPDAERRAHAVAQRATRDQGVRWLAAAAERGDVDAAVTLADFLSRSGAEFQAEAARWHRHAAELGDALSMARIARLLADGTGLPADAQASEDWYRRAADAFAKAAEADDAFAPFAMCQLAELSLRGHGVPQDTARAVALYERAAETGHHWAMLALGTLYERGDGVARDRQRALHWLQRAVAAGGDPYARSRLDDLRAEAKQEEETALVDGVRVDRALLARAEGGDAAALGAVALALDREGSPAAPEWQRRAAYAGDPDAAFRLFLAALGDDGRTSEEAKAWRRRAAVGGYVSALHMTGEELLDPDSGVPGDPVLGYAWLVVASRERNAYPRAVAALHRAQAAARARDVAEQLTAAQRTEADAIVARCDAGPPFRLPDEVDRG